MGIPVALARCDTYDPVALDAAIETAMAPLGGLAPLLTSAKQVLLKPNFLIARSADQAVTTHPQMIAAVARAVRAVYGGRILIGDGPAVGRTCSIARAIGLPPLLHGLNVDLVDFTKRVTAPGGTTLPMPIAREVAESDVIINLPKVKAHGMMYLTCGVKNMFGAFIGRDKPQLHKDTGNDYSAFARLLLDVAQVTAPALTIADGVVGMEGNGPSNGDARALGVVAASRSPLALDRVMCALLGMDPAAVPVMSVAAHASLPGTRLEDIELHGPPLAELAVPDWRPARAPLFQRAGLQVVGNLGFINAATTRPEFDHGVCTRCRICETHCLSGALSLQPRGRRHPGPNESTQHMAVDLDVCIRCYCCQELCPEGAIIIREGRIARFARWLGFG